MERDEVGVRMSFPADTVLKKIQRVSQKKRFYVKSWSFFCFVVRCNYLFYAFVYLM